jgi:hypothetical protein
MGILDELRGGQRKKDFQDFVKRYDQGHPSEGYSDEEVLEKYKDVAHEVPPDQYARAAQEALARLSPEERAALVRMMQERAQARNVQLPERMESNPRDLGQVFTDLHQTPGRLRDLLGGGAPAPPGQAQAAPEAGGGLGSLAGMLGSPLAKAALAGIAAMVARRVMRG